MSCCSGSNPVNSNLLLHLDAANVKSYPGSYDLSGNENHATFANTVEWEATNSGGLVFADGNETLRIAPNVSLDYLATGDFTVETFVKSTNVVYPGSRHPLYINGTVTSASTPGWSVGHRASTNAVEIRVADGTTLAFQEIANPPISEATHYHRVFTVNRDVGCLTKYYLNGSYMGQVDAPTVTGSIYDGVTTDHLTGVVFGFVYGWRYIGVINIIKIYKAVLTQDEINRNFTSYRSRYGV